MQFKVGDRVRLLRKSLGVGVAGWEGTLVKVDRYIGINVICWLIKYPGYITSNQWWARESDLEPVPVDGIVLVEDTRDYLEAVSELSKGGP